MYRSIHFKFHYKGRVDDRIFLEFFRPKSYHSYLVIISIAGSVWPNGFQNHMDHIIWSMINTVSYDMVHHMDQDRIVRLLSLISTKGGGHHPKFWSKIFLIENASRIYTSW